MKILYFVRGAPTEAQKKEAAKIGAVLRNANGCTKSDTIENCDRVYGEIPSMYSHIEEFKKPRAKKNDNSAT